MKKLFIDVSSLLIYARNVKQPSGIQRVTLMVIDESIKLVGADRVFISFYDKSKKAYVAVPSSVLDGVDVFDLMHFAAAMGVAGDASAMLPSLEKYSKRPYRRLFHKCVRNFNAAIGNENHFKKRRLTIEKWKAACQIVRKLEKSGDAIKAKALFDLAAKGDALVLMDANWDVLEAEQSISEAANNGMVVTSFIHDLIPLVTPQFVASTHSFKFGGWLMDTTKYSASYISNSVATGNDLREFFEKYDIALPVTDVPLAQAGLAKSVSSYDDQRDFDYGVDIKKHPALDRVADVSPDISSLLATPYVLCVGTVEVRKNVWRMAQAWKRLVEMQISGMPKLVFAGRKGWFVDDFFRFMDGTGWLGGWIALVEGPSDKELEFLYQNCDFAITASMYEGWGLPIGEGLSYGKTSVVANVSSMPEVGGELVEYCDPMSIASITAACEKLIADPGHRRMLEDRIAQTSLRSWRDVTVDILKAIDMDMPETEARDTRPNAAE